MIFGQLLRVFKARLWLILTIMAVTIATTAVASFLISKRYLGQATMVVEMPRSSARPSRQKDGRAVTSCRTEGSIIPTSPGE